MIMLSLHKRGVRLAPGIWGNRTRAFVVKRRVSLLLFQDNNEIGEPFHYIS